MMVSQHFALSEFACKCGGRLPGCLNNPRPATALVLGLEEMRAFKRAGIVVWPHGLSILSGYRCPGYNHLIGGAADSRHKHSDAADIEGRMTVLEVQFMAHPPTGIGWDRSTKLVTHIDYRPVRVTPWMYDR